MVSLISPNSSVRPDSDLGGLTPGCETVVHLRQHQQRIAQGKSDSQFITMVDVFSYLVDEEIVLIHINLYTRSPAIKVEQSLSAMLLTCMRQR